MAPMTIDRIIRTAVLATSLLACSAAAAPQDLESRVTEQVARLKSDDFKVRTAATEELVRLGRGALTTLEGLRSDDPEVRSRIAGAIARIRTTDPFFLLRSPERRTSVRVDKESVDDAYSRVFGAFPVPVPLSEMVKIDRNPRVSLILDNTGYWETVERFMAASKTFLEIERSGFRITGNSASRTSSMQRQGRFLVTARCSGRAITLQIHGEPGLLPLRATFKLREAAVASGESVISRLTVETPRAGLDQLQLGTSFPAATLAVLRLPEGTVPPGTLLRLEGTAAVELSRDLEAIEFRRAGAEQQVRVLSECSLTLNELRFEESSFKFNLATAGPKGWKAPAGSPFLETLWLVVADDEGRSTIPGAIPYAGVGTHELQAGWFGRRPPTRFCVIRVTGVETIDVPLVLDSLAVD